MQASTTREGPWDTPPQRDLEVAFKVFNNRKKLRDRERKAKYALLVVAIKEEISPAQVIADWNLRLPAPAWPGPCFQCNPSERWAKACPTCSQWARWKMDCPQGRADAPEEVPTFQTWKMECPQRRPGAPGEIPTSPQNPSPTLRELFQWRGPGSSPPARVPQAWNLG